MKGFLFAVFALLLIVSSATAAQSGQVTAGNTDDNLNFDLFLAWKARALQKQCGEKEECFLPNPKLSDRIRLEVREPVAGAPFSNAVIEVLSGDKSVLALPAGTNGKLSLFPSLDGLGHKASWHVRAKAPGGTCPKDCSKSVTVNATDVAAPVQITIPSDTALPEQLDITFVVDTTGSMCDELKFLQAELRDLMSVAGKTIDVRMAIVAYRDVGDAYVVRPTSFTTVADATAVLGKETCGGGGDFPEAMERALEAAEQLSWRAGNVARVLFLVADAPPHDPDFQRTLDAAVGLRKKGVRAYGLAASGAAKKAEYILRLMALITGARHTWLTDDSGVGDGHAEPSVVCYRVTRLNQLLARILKAELTGRRVEALPSEIIREVGQQKDGICVVGPPTNTSKPEVPLGVGPEGDHEAGSYELRSDSSLTTCSSLIGASLMLSALF